MLTTVYSALYADPLYLREGSYIYPFNGRTCLATFNERPERLADQLELLRCYYNFVRPHRALKFGGITRTPAMQAGITSRPWTFRMIFMAAHLAGSVLIWVCVSHRTIRQSSLARAA